MIVATAYGDSERTIGAMRDGAFDYLTKPFDFPLLLATVERAIRQRALAQSLDPAGILPTVPGSLVGTSAAMLAIWKLIGRAAASDIHSTPGAESPARAAVPSPRDRSRVTIPP